MPFETTQIDLNDTMMLSELSLTKKDKHHMIAWINEILKK